MPLLQPRTPNRQQATLSRSMLSEFTPQSRSSLPHKHYAMTLPSPGILSSFSNDTNDSIELSESTSSATLSCAGTSIVNGDEDKENSKLGNLKSRLAQSRLHRDSNSESFRSTTGKKGDDRQSKYNHNQIAGRKKSAPKSDMMDHMSRKRYKVDLMPRTAASGIINNPSFAKIGTLDTATSSGSGIAVPITEINLATEASMTQKCLRSALRSMQSKSYDSNSLHSYGFSIESSTSTNVSSLNDPCCERLNAIKKCKDRFTNRNASRSQMTNQTESCAGSQTSSTGASRKWLRKRFVNQEETVQSTFSVSPITKESTVVGSYIGSIRLDSVGNEYLESSAGSCAIGQLNHMGSQSNRCILSADSAPRAETSSHQDMPKEKLGCYNLKLEGGSSAHDASTQVPQTDSPQSMEGRVYRNQAFGNKARDNDNCMEDKDMLPLPRREANLVRIKSNQSLSSCAPSYATSTTSDGTNIFDALRNNNCSDEGSESEGDIVELRSTSPRTSSSSRPPLSPIPKQTSPKLSPNIVWGTKVDGRTPCSFATSSLVETSMEYSACTDGGTSGGGVASQQLEYSFLANALVATTLLKTPPIKTDGMLSDVPPSSDVDHHSHHTNGTPVGKAEAKALKEHHSTVEQRLRRRIHELESDKLKQDELLQQLRAERSESEKSLRKQINDLKSQLEGTIAIAEQNSSTNELTNLKQANQELLEFKQATENELMGYLRDNDILRRRLLEISNDLSMKEKTHSTAISEFKSLSDSHSYVTQCLKAEQKAHHDEVSSLQCALDSMSSQMSHLSEKVNQLQTENECIRDKLNGQSCEKERSRFFC